MDFKITVSIAKKCDPRHEQSYQDVVMALRANSAHEQDLIKSIDDDSTDFSQLFCQVLESFKF
jgi:hypothetical protein